MSSTAAPTVIDDVTQGAVPGVTEATDARAVGSPGALALHAHHIHRMEQVIDFIDLNLAADLRLNALASRANISPFHFHRLFHAWSGETVKAFVRRRRLETAAGQLRHCRDERVIDVSAACGFASPAAFARAFREQFGTTPTAWRSIDSSCGREGHGAGRAEVDAPHDGRLGGDADLPLPVEVHDHEAVEVAYLRGRGDYAVSAPPLWLQLRAWMDALSMAGQPLLSIGADDPSITAPQHCRLDACMQLPPGWIAPGARVLRRTVPGGLFATLRYSGPRRHIARGWDTLLKRWMPDSSYVLRAGQFLEQYDGAVSMPTDDIVQCDLLMPVRIRLD